MKAVVKLIETLRRNLAMIPTGSIIDPVKANAPFERALKGRCFYPRGKHNANCKAVKFPGASQEAWNSFLGKRLCPATGGAVFRLSNL